MSPAKRFTSMADWPCFETFGRVVRDRESRSGAPVWACRKGREHGITAPANGTAKNARLASYSVAGKTGTADKLVNGRYSSSQQNVSFVGFVPSRDPVLTVVVMVDSPRVGGDTGGAIAAPIFKRIADGAMRHLGVTPTINPAPPVTVGEPNVMAIPADMTQAGLRDLRGMSAREALRELAKVGLSARMQGVGVVVEQDPPAGSPYEPGATCTLVLNRVVPRSPGVVGDQR